MNIDPKDYRAIMRDEYKCGMCSGALLVLFVFATARLVLEIIYQLP